MNLKNSNCDETRKIKFGQNAKTQNVMKLKTQIVIKLKNSNFYDNENLKW